MTTIRTILINPFDRTITEHELAPGLAAIYAALSGPGFPIADTFPTDPSQWGDLERHPMRCTCMDIRSVGGGNDLIVDDEGRLIRGNACFTIGGHLMAGRALIAASNDEGETIATRLPLDVVRPTIVWRASNCDYTPPPPVVVGFSDPEMLKILLGH